jgi:hypothetical protein
VTPAYVVREENYLTVTPKHAAWCICRTSDNRVVACFSEEGRQPVDKVCAELNALNSVAFSLS